MREFINKYDKLIQWLAGFGIPVAVILSSWLITTSIERTKIDSEYVRIALSILAVEKKPDEDFKSDQIALRKWAIRLLNNKSPEKFTDEEQKALLESDLKYTDTERLIGALGVLELLKANSKQKQKETIKNNPMLEK